MKINPAYRKMSFILLVIISSYSGAKTISIIPKPVSLIVGKGSFIHEDVV